MKHTRICHQEEVQMESREEFEDFYQSGNDDIFDFSRWEDGEYCDDKVNLSFVIWEYQQNKINQLQEKIYTLEIAISELSAALRSHQNLTRPISRTAATLEKYGSTNCDHDWEDIGGGRMQCTYPECQMVTNF